LNLFVQDLDEHGVLSEAQYPVCYLCGSSDQGVTNPLHEVDLPTYGTYSCKFLERLGRNGGLLESGCSFLRDAFNSGLYDCHCCPVLQDTTIASRQPTKGVFRYKRSTGNTDNSTMATTTWSGGPYLPLFQDGTIQSNKMPLLFDHLSDELSEGAMKMLVSKKPTITQSFDRHECTNYYSINSDPGFGVSSSCSRQK
jgi:hypothetical protein